MEEQEGAGQKGTHAVTEKEIGQVRKFLPCPAQQGVAVLGGSGPAAVKIEGRGAAVGSSVAHVIFTDHQISLGSEEFCKIIVAHEMLGDAVDELHHGHGLAHRLPTVGVDHSGAL